jgi:TPR repeat protein
LDAAAAGEPGTWTDLGTIRDWWLHDMGGARDAYRRAADSGDAEGLTQLAFLDWLDGDLVKARAGMERAATLGSGQAGGALARLPLVRSSTG